MEKFYIICVTYKIEGLFAIVNSVLDHVIYARENGYIPIVDLKHYYNQYFKDNRVFKDNVWEYFFDQPNGYALGDLNENSQITLSLNCQSIDNGNVIWNSEIPKDSNFKNPKLIERKNLYKNLLKFNQQTQKYLDEKFVDLIDNGDDVLGILCRGTDYTKKRSLGEFIQPKTKSIIKKARQIIKKYPKIKRIYIATEDIQIYQDLKKEFGDMLIENNQYKFTYDENDKRYLSEIQIKRENHNYNLAKEYLLSIYILSKCRYFIGGRTTGTKWAWILSNNWEYYYIWNLGRYGKTIKEKVFSKTTTIKDSKPYEIIQILGIKIRKKLK